MTLLSPLVALAAAGVVLPALLAMYFLKLRRRQVDVPSTFLWRRAVQDLQVNAPFQRLRRNLLLLLQLLVLIFLLAALARPVFHQETEVGPRIVIIIDRSASMRARDGQPTRLDDAKRRAIALIDAQAAGRTSADDSAPGSESGVPSPESGSTASSRGRVGGSAMVITFAHQAQVVQPFTSDITALRRAIESIEPTDGPSRLEPALKLVEPFAQVARVGQAAAPVVHVFTDGQVQVTAGISLPGVEVVYQRVGGGAAAITDGGNSTGVDNVGIIGLSARRDARQPENVEVFARLSNSAGHAIDTEVALRLNSVVQHVARVSLPPAAPGSDEPGIATARFQLPITTAALVEVSHDHRDLLDADDRAGLVVTEPHQPRILLVTPGNAFLEQAVRSAGVAHLFRVTPEQYEANLASRIRRARRGERAPSLAAPSGAVVASDPESSDAGFDVVLFDRHSPRATPAIDALYFNAAPPIPGLRTAGEVGTKGEAVLDWKREHALLRYVSMDDVVMVGAGRLVLPDGAQVLATGAGGPVLACVRVGGVNHVVASFDVLRTNWPMQVGFPVFIANAMSWLALGGQTEAGASFRTGEVATVVLDSAPGTGMVSSATEVEYDGPVPLCAAVDQGRALLPPFERAGVYRARGGAAAAIAGPNRVVAVNLADMRESDLRPAADLRLGSRASVAATGKTQTRREVWPWLVAAALVMVCAEWVIYTRRMHL